MYYLKSRYYNPEWGRFINADAITGVTGDLLSHNMFVYCKNNPVNLQDSNGFFPWIVGAAMIGASFNAASQIISNIASGEKWYKGVAGAAVGGAVTAALAVTGVGLFGSSLAGAFVNSAMNEAEGAIFRKEKISLSNLALNTAFNTGANMIGGKVAEKLVPINKGWFKPKTLKGSFTSKTAQKTMVQSTVSGVYSIVGNIISGEATTNWRRSFCSRPATDY